MIDNKAVEYYPKLLDFTFRVVNSLKGRKEADYRMLGCEHLAMKIFIHAATINHLRAGSNVTLAAYKDGAHLIDFPAILILSRSVLETYMTLFEVFFEPISDDEFEYRHAVYELNGFKIAELIIRNNPNPSAYDFGFMQDVQKRIQEIEAIRERIRKTAIYKTLDRNQKKATVEGTLYPRRKPAEIAKVAGFGEKTVENMYAYLSAHSHGDALSVAQIKDAVSDEQKDSYIRLGMALVMMVLSHVILNYAQKFPEAKAVCNTNPDDYNLAVILAKQASSMR